MIRRLYDWTMKLSGSRHAQAGLTVVSFAESSFFPIPPDVVLIPMVLARPERAWTYAAICTVASVLGGILGYAIGYFLQPVGQALLALLGHADGEAAFRAWFAQWGLWVILIKGLTPIPYKLVTIASGLAHFAFPMFLAASIATRGARFFLVAFVVKRFGPAVLPVIERRLTLFAVAAVVLIVGGVIAARLLH